MTESRRRRALGAAVLGSALLLAGCAVPGQEGSPGVAAASEQTTLTSARVAELYDAWAFEAHKPIPRDQVVTLEAPARADARAHRRAAHLLALLDRAGSRQHQGV
ncbi:hypothetical protein [Demequina litorisediminis]|uniref:Uncharacterized protein n=1 Tax=Demequina litorisediminis TaxID=1849022 RepID=A0ABQ6IB93_9MICO|nr:hypothetical protein [Demequina litorisediminis]GMA35000.1 hypothetical protein GCM10025876_12040 [Demequina litorisediminis]